ncbi:MAG: ATP-dependent Clp protease ATP-binding subunit ClpX, partial [Bacteroidales bacterium]|nr:ATP-dependent Clp protease ATP-binding subunit ClpX [Bacteroidales bacterium]
MFCGRKESEVPFLLQGLDGYICSDCVELAHEYLNDTVRETAAKSSSERIDDKNKPADIKAFLDQYV